MPSAARSSYADEYNARRSNRLPVRVRRGPCPAGYWKENGKCYKHKPKKPKKHKKHKKGHDGGEVKVRDNRR